MTIKRSYFHLLFGSLGVALVLTNCTVKEDTDDSCEKGDKDVGCECPGSTTGYQECKKDGTFGSCICPGSGGSSSGGTSNAGAPTDAGSDGGGTTSTGGTGGSSGGTGGTSEAGSDAGGEGGTGGEPSPTFDTCDQCLDFVCGEQVDACLASELCVDQWAKISVCIDNDRANGLVKRDHVRGCGVTLGDSTDASLAADWPPNEMDPAMTDLLNCMATSASIAPPNGDWADEAAFPNGMPSVWPDDSCAKLACTSEQKPE